MPVVDRRHLCDFVSPSLLMSLGGMTSPPLLAVLVGSESESSALLWPRAGVFPEPWLLGLCLLVLQNGQNAYEAVYPIAGPDNSPLVPVLNLLGLFWLQALF